MKEKLSQQKLLEVLTHEIEVLRKTSKDINETAPIISERLEELKQTKLTAEVDLKGIIDLLNDHKHFLHKKTTLPSWLVLLLAVSLLIIMFQSYYLYTWAFSG